MIFLFAISVASSIEVSEPIELKKLGEQTIYNFIFDRKHSLINDLYRLTFIKSITYFLERSTFLICSSKTLVHGTYPLNINISFFIKFSITNSYFKEL